MENKQYKCLSRRDKNKNEFINAEKKNHFLEHMMEHRESEKVYPDGSKQEGKNFGFAAVFKNETVYGTLPIKAQIYTAEISIIEIALKIINKKENKTGQCALTLRAQYTVSNEI